jgi:hypothetical protein
MFNFFKPDVDKKVSGILEKCGVGSLLIGIYQQNSLGVILGMVIVVYSIIINQIYKN